MNSLLRQKMQSVGGIGVIFFFWVCVINTLSSLTKPPSYPSTLGYIFVWLLTGTLVRFLEPSYGQKKFRSILWGLIMGWLVLVLIWVLPIWFPSLQSNDYGVRLDLRNSPLILWVAIAFLLGYYQQVALHAHSAIWKKMQKNWINKEEGFAKNRLNMLLRGLGQVLGIHRS